MAVSLSPEIGFSGTYQTGIGGAREPNSDQIVVLHKGQVIERGTHAELLELDGAYSAMWLKQTTAEREKKEKEEKAETSSDGQEG